jgi:hypothetical protein
MTARRAMSGNDTLILGSGWAVLHLVGTRHAAAAKLGLLHCADPWPGEATLVPVGRMNAFTQLTGCSYGRHRADRSQATSQRLATAAAPRAPRGIVRPPAAPLHRDRDRPRPGRRLLSALPMRTGSPRASAMVFTKMLMSADLPEWWGTRHSKRMGNSPSSTFAPPPHAQRRLHGPRWPPPPPRPAGQTPGLRRPTQLPTDSAGRRLEHSPARHPPRHHPAGHPPRDRGPSRPPATPPPAARPPAAA